MVKTVLQGALYWTYIAQSIDLKSSPWLHIPHMVQWNGTLCDWMVISTANTTTWPTGKIWDQPIISVPNSSKMMFDWFIDLSFPNCIELPFIIEVEREKFKNQRSPSSFFSRIFQKVKFASFSCSEKSYPISQKH